MKKIYFFLTLLLSLVAFKSNAQCYAVGNLCGWDPEKAKELTLKDGVYVGTFDFPDSGDGYSYFQFISKKGKWDVVNGTGTRYGAESENLEMKLSVPYKIATKNTNNDPNGWSWKLRPGNYTAMVNLEKQEVQLIESECFLLLDVKDETNKASVKLPKIAKDVFSGVVKFSSKTGGDFCYFKVRRGIIECGSYRGNDSHLDTESPYDFSELGLHNGTWYVNSGEEYLVTVDYRKTGGPFSIKLDPVNKAYLMGNINDYSWNPSTLVELTREGETQIYKGTVELKKDADFCVVQKKGFDENDWSVNFYRYGAEPNGENQITTYINPYEVTNLNKNYNGGWKVAEAGTYTVSVDFNLNKIEIKRPKVLIEFDNGETKSLPYNTTLTKLSGLVKTGQKFRIKETNTGFIYGSKKPLLNESTITLTENWSSESWMTAPFDIVNMNFKYDNGVPLLYISETECFLLLDSKDRANRVSVKLPKIAEGVFSGKVKFTSKTGGDKCFFKVTRGDVECGAFNREDYELSTRYSYAFEELGQHRGNWYVANGEEYLVTLDYSKAPYNIKIDPINKAYLYGDINKFYTWDPSYLLELRREGDTQIYEITIELKKDADFCVVQKEGTDRNDFSLNWYRYGAEPNAENQIATYINSDEETVMNRHIGAGWKVPATGDYKVTVDFTNNKIKLVPEGIFFCMESDNFRSLPENKLVQTENRNIYILDLTGRTISGEGLRFCIKDNTNSVRYGRNEVIDINSLPGNNVPKFVLSDKVENFTVNSETAITKVYVHFIDNEVSIYLENDVTTSVEDVTEDVEIVAGKGTIDVAGEGNDVKVYSINGVLVSEGQNHVELEAGIYIVKVGNAVKKVVVR